MKCLLVVLFALVSVTAFGGVGSSGGGFAVVCKNSLGQHTRAPELLDLFEARERYRIPIFVSRGSLEADYLQAVVQSYAKLGVDAVARGWTASIQRSLPRFFEQVRFKTSPLVRLNDIGFTALLPLGCTVEPLAVYHDESDLIDIDAQLWALLDTRSQAALVMHEIFYREGRNRHEFNSESARAMVVDLLSSAGLTPVLTLMQEKSLYCTGAGLPPLVMSWTPISGSVANQVRFVDSTRYAYLPKFNFSLMPSELPGVGRLVAVWDTSVPRVGRVPLRGAGTEDWLELKQRSGESLQMSVLENGAVVHSGKIENCKGFVQMIADPSELEKVQEHDVGRVFLGLLNHGFRVL